MLKGDALGALLKLLPADWKKSLSIHLGAPHVEWSLKQLRLFGFHPEHVLDVGAFRGDWARACLKVFPQAHLTCIEPQDGQQPPLRALSSQAPNVQVVQTLLGRTDLVHVPFPEAGSGSSVLGYAQGSPFTKPVATIDTLIESGRCKPPNLIKLDVQGYEIEVLEGWARGFDQCQVIQCEISLLPLVPGGPLLHELVAYLKDRRFVMFDITELIRSPSDGAVWQIDAIFCRSDSPLRKCRVWR